MNLSMCQARKLSELRIAAIILGSIQSLWATIPLFDLERKSLFARVLFESETEEVWFFIAFGLGITMIIGGLFRARGVLFWSLVLNSFAWLAGAAPFIVMQEITPVSISMPIFGLGCLALLAKEVALNPKGKNNDDRNT